jgi:hypothetical protein
MVRIHDTSLQFPEDRSFPEFPTLTGGTSPVNESPACGTDRSRSRPKRKYGQIPSGNPVFFRLCVFVMNWPHSAEKRGTTSDATGAGAPALDWLHAQHTGAVPRRDSNCFRTHKSLGILCRADAVACRSQPRISHMENGTRVLKARTAMLRAVNRMTEANALPGWLVRHQGVSLRTPEAADRSIAARPAPIRTRTTTCLATRISHEARHPSHRHRPLPLLRNHRPRRPRSTHDLSWLARRT